MSLFMRSVHARAEHNTQHERSAATQFERERDELSLAPKPTRTQSLLFSTCERRALLIRIVIIFRAHFHFADDSHDRWYILCRVHVRPLVVCAIIIVPSTRSTVIIECDRDTHTHAHTSATATCTCPCVRDGVQSRKSCVIRIVNISESMLHEISMRVRVRLRVKFISGALACERGANMCRTRAMICNKSDVFYVTRREPIARKSNILHSTHTT